MNNEPPVTFIWPTMLWLLLLIVPLIGLYLRIQLRRKRMQQTYSNFGLLQQANGKSLGLRRHIPVLFFLIGLIILIVALARPEMFVTLPRLDETVILAFDVSGSMAADDMQPTRMEAAKTIAKDFVEHQPITVQIGVVTFSDGGFSVQPPTNDKTAILASINRVSPQRGTSLASGILTALDIIGKQLGQIPPESGDLPSNLVPTLTPVPKGTYSSGVIVLFSDGENNVSPDPLSAAQTAADRGVRIHTVGLGSLAGTTLKVNGFTVHTQLDEAMLQQISQMTGGTYHNALSEDDLRKIYENINPQLVIKPAKTEVTAIFAGFSLLFLLIGGALSLLWFSRIP